MSDLASVLTETDTWGADHAAAAVVGPAGVLATHGDPGLVFRWASVTKIATALTVLIAVERGLVDLDEACGPPGSTIRHLLAHASGLTFDGPKTVARPGTRRIYSNAGFDLLGDLVAERVGGLFAAALESLVLGPLAMTGTRLRERPSQGLYGPISDLARLANELLRPTLLTPATFRSATTVAFPGLVGLLPGVGRFDPLDWGLGLELHDEKSSHWMADTNSPGTVGHFGGSGTFLWADPAADLALAVLTDRAYGPWALDVWPAFSAAILVSARDDGQAGRPA
jgi:CubicO group peptidase (beta-lactamase class C family)